MLTISLLAPIISAKPAHAASITHNYNWTRLTQSHSDAYDQVLSTQTDSNGNVYTYGEFSGTVVFDGPGGTHTGTTESSIYNAFLTKRSPSGAYLWTKTINLNNDGYVTPARMVIDNDGDDSIYFTGFSTGTISFEDFGSSDSITTESGKSDMFLVKLNADGSYAWSRHSVVASSNGFAEPVSLTTGIAGNVVIIGGFKGTANFDQSGSDDHTSGSSGARQDLFVTSFGTDGSYQWTFTTSSSSGSVQASAVIASWTTDNIVIAGRYNGTTTFDGPGGTDTHSATLHGLTNSFILALDDSGNYVSTYFMDQSQGDVMITDMALDWSNNLLITGAFLGTVVFDGPGGTDSITAPHSGSLDAFVTKMHWDGANYYWTKILDNTSGGAVGEAITMDWWGNIYLGGTFAESIGFDGVGGDDTQTTDGDPAMFVSSWNEADAYRYTQVIGTPFGGNNSVSPGSITSYRDTLYVGGQYSDAATFDGPGGHDTHTSGSISGDGFLSSWRIGPPLATTSSPKVVHITSPTNSHSFSGGSVHVTGTGAPNAHIAVQVDGQTKQTVLANGGGNWAATLTGLDAGNHTISASFVTSHAIAYMSDPGNQQIHVVDIVNQTPLATIDRADANSYLESLAVSPSGKIIVTAGGSQCYVGVLDPKTNIVTKLATQADYPYASSYCDFRAIAFSADSSTAYVSMTESDGVAQAGNIIAFNLASGTHTTHNTDPYCSDPYGLSLNTDQSEFWINCPGRNSIEVYNAMTFAHKHSIDLGSGAAYNNIVFANNKAYIGDQWARRVDIVDDDGSYTLNFFTHGIDSYTNSVVTPDGAYVYALDPYSDNGHKITIIRTSDDSFVKDIFTQQPSESIAIADDTAGHLIVGDDHSTGEIYFGTNQNQDLTDGLAFDGGTFSTYNSDFLLPAGSHTFSDSVRVTMAGATADQIPDSTAPANDDAIAPTPTPEPGHSNGDGEPTDQTGRTSDDTAGIGYSNTGLYVTVGSGLGILIIIILWLIFRRRRDNLDDERQR